MILLLDVLGTLISLLSTYYFIRLSHKAWLISLLATCLNGWLYWQKGIYADMTLEVFYFLNTCYGLYLWDTNSQKTPSVFTLSKSQWAWLGLCCTILFIVMAALLSLFTSSNVSILDSLTTSLSLLAQWLMCHKVISTWILWFLTDALYAFMYASKQLPFHSLLMLFYTGIAVIGYRTWIKHPLKKTEKWGRKKSEI